MKRWIEAGLLAVAAVFPLLFEQVAWADAGLVGRWAPPLADGSRASSGRSAFFQQISDQLERGQSPGWLKLRTPTPTPTPPPAAVPTKPAGQTATAVGPDPGKGYVRLPGHVLDVLAHATPTAAAGVVPLSPQASAAEQPMTLTLVLKRDDPEGFRRYMREVYDPHSQHYQKFLGQAQLTKRYGPSRRSYARLLGYLRSNGLQLVDASANRMTLTVRGSRAQVERTFDVAIGDYQLGGSRFYATQADPALPAALAAHVRSVSGLSSAGAPQPAAVVLAGLLCAAAGLFFLVPIEVATFGLGGQALLVCILAALAVLTRNFPPNNGPVNPLATGRTAQAQLQATAQTAAGSGQTVGLLEFDTYKRSDVEDFLALAGMEGSSIDNLSDVAVNGGISSPGAGESEVLLDIDTVMSIAPGAKLRVYSAPFDGHATSYSALFNAMINDGVTVISNSWASCEDQVSQADAEGIDSVLQTAAASGISVFNGAGDTGSTCLDGGANTVAVPADSPNATAVGGTSLTPAPGLIYGSETWWNGTAATPPTGQGGFGLSRYFSRPDYQDGLNGNAMRSVPDVSFNADPENGMLICQSSNGGCPSGLLYGGTSMAAPAWAALTATLNAAQGKNLGALNPQLYLLANTAAFHDAASMGSDFAHVGLGSPDANVLRQKLSGEAVGAPDADVSQVLPLAPANLQSQGISAIPADGSTPGGVLVRLLDANGFAVAGKTISVSAGGSASVTPASAVTSADGEAVFSITDQTAETLNLSVTDTSDNLSLTPATVDFAVPPATSAGLNVFPTEVTADGVSAATIAITLQDSLGRPTPGKTITISQGSGQSVISGPVPAVTDSNGQITFTATDQTNESVTYSAVDVSDGDLPIPGSGSVTFSDAGPSDCTSNPPVGANGYAVTPWATGFPASTFFYADVNFYGCPGATNPAFDPSGAVYVADFYDGNIYTFDAAGGSATPGNVTTNPSLGPSLGNLVYGKDGRVYTTLITGGYFTEGSIVQVDPANGTILRTVATGYTCPGGLAVDPLSGDLFFDDGCYGAGSDNASLWRISDPAGTDPSNPTAVSVYATLPYTANGPVAFAPDGTLYVSTGNPAAGHPGGWFIAEVSATDAAQPASVNLLTGINSDNSSLAIGATNDDGSAKTLVVHETAPSDTNGGALQTVDITTDPPSVVQVLATGDIGIGTIGPDGCNYVGAHHNVYKLAPESGNCGLTPSSPGPALVLSPASFADNPAQGTAQTFTATLNNVASPAGTAVLFTVSGANPQVKLVRADDNGRALLSYTAVNAGTDTIVATATVSSSTTTTGGLQVQAAPRSRINRRAVSHAAPVPAAVAAQRRAGMGRPFGLPRKVPAVQPSAASLVARNTSLARTAAVVVPADSGTSSISLKSNRAQVSWVGGAHVSFLTLNPSPTSGAIGQAVTLVASLSDVSASPAAAASAQSIHFTLGDASCTATTDSGGLARCTLTPSAAGSFTLSASYAGSDQLTAATASTAFTVTPTSSGSTSGGSGGGSGGGGGGGGAADPALLVLLAAAELIRRRRGRGRIG